MTKEEKIIEILKSCENRIDDSDYHEKAIFPCDYNYIAKEIATLESHQPEETILVDDPSLPNIGRRISKKEYESQFSKEQPKKTAEEWLKENGYTNIMTMTPDNLAIILKRYASQGQPEVTDEEIEKWAEDQWKPIQRIIYKKALIIGAKWVRDKLTGR